MQEKDTTAGYLFTAPGAPIKACAFPVPTPELGAAVCRVRLATICGSDLHTWRGRRQEPAPLVLGHEIVGEVVALGEGLTADATGAPLCVGDRVTWSIMACCGACWNCTHGLPQKCAALKKYGHTCCDDGVPLSGGYAEHVYLWPGTAIYRVPAALPDEVAAPANCALATVVNAFETIEAAAGERVLIQGAGMLGLYAAAWAKELGMGPVIMCDVNAERLALAMRFGADQVVDLSTMPAADCVSALRALSGGRGVDVAIEVSGASAAVPLAVEALRIGGRYLVAGLVTPGNPLDIDGNTLTRKCLTLRGIHNYRPEHLGQALRFLETTAGRYPYAALVGAVYPLEDLEAAFETAESGAYVRVGVAPGNNG